MTPRMNLGMNLVAASLAIGALVSACVWSADGSARGVHQKQVVSFFPACAPWGGEAYNLTFPVGDGGSTAFDGAIWGQGLTAFREDHAFSIDNVMSVQGHGRAQISDKPIVAQFSPPIAGKGNVDGEPPMWTVSFSLPDKPDDILVYDISPAMVMLQPICR